MQQRIRDILSGLGGLSKPSDTIADGEDLFALGLDSFGLVDLMVAIETEFGLEFPEAMLKRDTFKTVHNLAQAVSQLLEQRSLV